MLGFEAQGESYKDLGSRAVVFWASRCNGLGALGRGSRFGA